ncbi:MAG: flagellar biosynthesis anti-sigma factor FlgM [Acidimicrobiia bacterium]
MNEQQRKDAVAAASLATRASRRVDLAVSIEAVRARVRSGSYHPSSDDVAEHLLAWLFGERVDDHGHDGGSAAA